MIAVALEPGQLKTISHLLTSKQDNKDEESCIKESSPYSSNRSKERQVENFFPPICSNNIKKYIYIYIHIYTVHNSESDEVSHVAGRRKGIKRSKVMASSV